MFLVVLLVLVVVVATQGAALRWVWQLAVWLWQVNPPIMTLLYAAAGCGFLAALLYPRESRGWQLVRVMVPVTLRRPEPDPVLAPVAGYFERLRTERRQVTAPATVTAEPLAEVVSLRPERVA